MLHIFNRFLGNEVSFMCVKIEFCSNKDSFGVCKVVVAFTSHNYFCLFLYVRDKVILFVVFSLNSSEFAKLMLEKV